MGLSLSAAVIQLRRIATRTSLKNIVRVGLVSAGLLVGGCVFTVAKLELTSRTFLPPKKSLKFFGLCVAQIRVLSGIHGLDGQLRLNPMYQILGHT
jgi:hypothetical protein